MNSVFIIVYKGNVLGHTEELVVNKGPFSLTSVETKPQRSVILSSNLF